MAFEHRRGWPFRALLQSGRALSRAYAADRAWRRRFVLRLQSDLERLLKRSFTGVDLDRVMRGLGVVKSALDENNLCLAQIAAMQLRIPDPPSFLARAELETEDGLIKADRGGDGLARGGWDLDKHPRAGTPPNPGWFAPTDGSSATGSSLEGEVDGRAPMGVLHPALASRPNTAESGSPILPVAERSTGNPDYAARALRMDRNVLSERLHAIKDNVGLSGNDNVRIMIPSGDVYYGSDYIGNLRE